MQFSYRLTGTGWATAQLVDGDRAVELPASYLSDTLAELLVALGAIQEGAPVAECSWEEEPGEYRWSFVRDADDLGLQLLAFASSHPRRPDDEGVVIFQCTEPAADMQRAFTRGIRAVLDEWGEEGYLAKWVQYPFPTNLLQTVESRIDGA